jgi:hypothetical protein
MRAAAASAGACGRCGQPTHSGCAVRACAVACSLQPAYLSLRRGSCVQCVQCRAQLALLLRVRAVVLYDDHRQGCNSCLVMLCRWLPYSMLSVPLESIVAPGHMMRIPGEGMPLIGGGRVRCLCCAVLCAALLCMPADTSRSARACLLHACLHACSSWYIET